MFAPPGATSLVQQVDVVFNAIITIIVVRGHHVYKKVWRPVTGQVLPVLVELSNRHDRRAVVIVLVNNIKI